MLRKLLRFIDKTFGRLVIIILILYDRALRPPIKRPGKDSPGGKKIKNILVIKIVGLGDTVLMLTPIKRLREHYADVKISALVTSLSSGILADQRIIDEVIIYQVLDQHKGILDFIKLIRYLRSKRFDCVIDFEHHFKLVSVISYLTGAAKRIGFHYNQNLRGRLYTHSVFLDPGRHMVDSFMELLKPLDIESKQVKSLEKIHIHSSDEERVTSWLTAHGIKDNNLMVAIHAGSGLRALSRRWDKEKFAEIIRRLNEQYQARVILTGSRDEHELLEQIIKLAPNGTVYNSAGQLDLKGTAALMKRCQLVISNDTGPMHIAAAMGARTIGLFGPNLPSRYAPIGKNNAFIYKKVKCSPCIQVHEGKVFECQDPICMHQIGVEEVWTAIKQQLS